MEKEMFCFQCEQTAFGSGCVSKAGVCGKTASTAALQDKLLGALIGLSETYLNYIEPFNRNSDETPGTYSEIKSLSDRIVLEGLFTTITNVNFNNETISALIDKVHTLNRQIKEALKKEIAENSSTAETSESCVDFDMGLIWNADEDIRSLKSLILFGIKGMAAYAYHADALGFNDKTVNSFFFEALAAIGDENIPKSELLHLVLKVGEVNLRCMELLDKANTSAYGDPEPAEVTTVIEPGPFIIVTGHDLRDLKLLLEQTDGKGINIYTHGEMLPAHGYPELKKYPHLKGNFGTAWQNQQKEFDNVPGAVLFTTNCLMPVKENYADRVFTTEVVSYLGIVHIGADKDFTPVIKRAAELGGYDVPQHRTGINGGDHVVTGFGHKTVLKNAALITEAVKSGQISRFFLIGGCDGARPGRNYYTEFAKLTPPDSIILTLACGKYRFNDLDLGSIGPFQRIMDMGQCNDAYSAVLTAKALAEAFNCGINELPLSIVLSWYEQKAVSVLLTLLYLGINNILLGPALPAFISPNILKYLSENYNIAQITTPEEDMKKLIGI